MKTPLSGWKQRLAVHAHLEPLSVDEACDYLLHHLRLAEGKPDRIIDESGMEVIARHARHSAAAEPRRAAALVLADAAELEIVDAEARSWRWPPLACKWRRRTTSKKPRWWHERG